MTSTQGATVSSTEVDTVAATQVARVTAAPVAAASAIARNPVRYTTAKSHTDVVLLGVGTIGRTLIELCEQVDRNGSIRICGLVDRTGYLFNSRGLTRRQLADAIACKLKGGSLIQLPGATHSTPSDAINAISSHQLSHPILVDVTAADTSSLLESSIAQGWNVVLANKVPLAALQTDVDRLHETVRANGRRLLHEATVGAGLPVIDTLNKLLNSGDRVLRIEGCPSGTLGYLFGELGRGQSFSSALHSAVSAGYTEPDPRIDLSGMDVARKALILARMLGFRGDLAEIAVESLVPAELSCLPFTEFLDRVGQYDEAWEQRVTAARADNRVLRYRASITSRSIRVGLVAVPLSDPLGSLSGTDNQFAFTTSRYREQPLVITGPGAGAVVTAAGVLNDLQQLVWSRGDSRPGDRRR